MILVGGFVGLSSPVPGVRHGGVPGASSQAAQTRLSGHGATVGYAAVPTWALTDEGDDLAARSPAGLLDPTPASEPSRYPGPRRGAWRELLGRWPCCTDPAGEDGVKRESALNHDLVTTYGLHAVGGIIATCPPKVDASIVCDRIGWEPRRRARLAASHWRAVVSVVRARRRGWCVRSG